MAFPINPDNGTIYEDTSGIFYQYNSATQSWYKISSPSIPLASIFNDGLMSSTDFIKLTGLLIPPPQISLSFEDCEDVSFSEGWINITGSDDGIVQVDVGSNLHENTAPINFKLDVQKLTSKMLALGTLSLTTQQGDQGAQGEQGDAGANALPVGPQGSDGIDGKNAEWLGTLAEEAFGVAQQSRAIVDIDTLQVSEAENYLVVYRANIGNPEACPSTIIPQDLQSPWLLAYDSYGNATFSQIISPATGLVCGWACHSSLFYFDADVIMQSIYTQWANYLNMIKTQKETLANTWLTALIDTFNDQKSALCCALEACKSRTRNVETRRYIEQQRIQAANGGFQLVVGGEDDKDFPPMDRDGACTWDIAPANDNLTYLSDPNCLLDWEELCPATVDHSWRPWPLMALSMGAAPDIPNVEVTASTAVADAATSASGTYIDGQYTEFDEFARWAWYHGDWVLIIWKCHADNLFAARLYDSSSNERWDYGGSQNVTSCFMAGDLIPINAVESGVSFTISGSNELSDGYASIQIS